MGVLINHGRQLAESFVCFPQILQWNEASESICRSENIRLLDVAGDVNCSERESWSRVDGGWWTYSIWSKQQTVAPHSWQEPQVWDVSINFRRLADMKIQHVPAVVFVKRELNLFLLMRTQVVSVHDVYNNISFGSLI